ncbi:isopenicillin N synthase family dioxygenase [Pararobbsia silviterrae]|nr:2-oxoglutarate and iron-dependent oxygenase domain-containing protein [Pararobbsia silviterrae]
MIPYTPPQSVSALPIVDLSLLDESRDARLTLAAQIRDACRNIGFFYVRNHGVPRAVFDTQYALARELFDLPLDVKMEIAQSRSAAKRGYEPAATQRLDDGSPPDLKESFRYGPEPARDHPLYGRGLPTYGPNQWPRGKPEMATSMGRYADAMVSLGLRVMRAIALSLELRDDFFEPYYADPMTTVRLLKYPPHPDHALMNQIGAGAHTDWGGITILAQDEVGGLEVRNVDGVWIQAPPLPDTLIVNIGDLLAMWTGNRYRSTLHRVKTSAARTDRYSIAFFFDPRYDAIIERVPSCRGEDVAPDACTAGAYIAERHRATAVEVEVEKEKG